MAIEATMFIVGMAVGVLIGGAWISFAWIDYMKNKGDWR